MILDKAQFLEMARASNSKFFNFYTEKPKDVKTDLTVFSVKEKDVETAIFKLEQFLNANEGMYFVLMRSANNYRANAGSLVQLKNYKEAPKTIFNGEVVEDYTLQENEILELKNRIRELESVEHTRERIISGLWRTINPQQKDVTEIINGFIFGQEQPINNGNTMSEEQLNEMEQALQVIVEKLGEDTVLAVAKKLKNDHLGIITKMIKNNLG